MCVFDTDDSSNLKMDICERVVDEKRELIFDENYRVLCLKNGNIQIISNCDNKI